MRERTFRRAVSLVTVLVVTPFGVDAIRSLATAGRAVAGQWSFIAMVALPGAMVVHSVARRRFSLSWAVYWAWSFVFLGLAPAYQVSAGRFPWGGVFSDHLLVRSARVVLLGHVVVLAVTLWRLSEGPEKRRDDAVDLPSPALERVARLAVAAQVSAGLLFVAAMGPGAMAAGKFAFQARLLEVAQLPAGGTLYFLASGLACIVPALAIVIYRAHGRLSRLSVWVAVLVAATVTNPFIGSRFLTGSFLVATVGALLSGRPTLRLVPAGTVTVFAFVFPSLDLWRGDDTGSTGLAFAAPSETLRSFDFDAFEMLTRGVDVHHFSPQVLEPPLRSVVGAVVHWVPFLTDLVSTQPNSGAVAGATGMAYRNVSMPLAGEGFVLGAWLGVVVAMGLLALLLRGIMTRVGRASLVNAFLLDAPVAALLFIVLRGSIYSALGYLLLAVGLGGLGVAVNRSKGGTLIATAPGEIHAKA